MELLRLSTSVFGPRPAFHETDAYRALWIIAGGQTDRKSLAQKLKIGEGSTRSVLKQLLENKLIEVRKRGAVLTKEGESFVSELKKSIPATGKIEKTDLTFQQEAYAVRMQGSLAGRIKGGIEQRDAAIRAGASGATVLCLESGRLVFPDSGYAVSQAQKNLFEEKLGELREGDAIIMCYGESELARERGAWNAAIGIKTEEQISSKHDPARH